MARFFFTLIMISIGLISFAQEAVTHEPTSATDADVKLHNTKKSRFLRSSKTRGTERQGSSIKDSRYKAEARSSERHGKSVKKTKGSRKMNGEARVFNRHGASSSSATTKKYRVRRALGRNTE